MIPDLFKRNLTVKRRLPSTLVDGIWIKGVATNFVIRASVQPTNGKVLETLPEGFRNKSTYTLFTNSELISAEQGSNSPDIVVIFNKQYVVVRIENWGNTDLAHFEVVVVESDADVNL